MARIMQEVLKSALGNWADKGYSLNEPDDHILELLFEGKVIARFNAQTVTYQVISNTISEYSLWNKQC